MVWGIMITVGLHILCARRLFDFMADNYLELTGKRSIYNERKKTNPSGVSDRRKSPVCK